MADLKKSRPSFSICHIRNYIFVIAKSSERYNLLSDTWSLVPGADLPRPQTEGCTATVVKRFVYVFGDWKFLRLDTLRLSKGWQQIPISSGGGEYSIVSLGFTTPDTFKLLLVGGISTYLFTSTLSNFNATSLECRPSPRTIDTYQHNQTFPVDTLPQQLLNQAYGTPSNHLTGVMGYFALHFFDEDHYIVSDKSLGLRCARYS